MKKTAAVLAAIACLGISAAAYADSGDNIIDDVLSGAEDVVDGVVSGADEILTPGDSNSVPESGGAGGSDSAGNSPESTPQTTAPQTTTPSQSDTNSNVNTGVPVAELAALGAVAAGGLGVMALTLKKKK